MPLNEKIRRRIETLKNGSNEMTPSERYKEAMARATEKADEATKHPSNSSREEALALFDIARARADELVRWHVNGRK